MLKKSRCCQADPVVLVGTYRVVNSDWIDTAKLYNLPITLQDDNTHLLSSVTHLALFSKNSDPKVFTAKFYGIESLEWLQNRGYKASDKPRSGSYAVFELGEAVDAGALLTKGDAKIWVQTSAWKGPVDKDFYSKLLPSCDGESTANLFARLKPYLQWNQNAKSGILQQMEFFELSGVQVKSQIPFPGPKKPKFTFIDLFAGIGGFRLAMQSCGGQCVFSSEWDEQAQKTYKANYGGEVHGDITKINPTTIPPFDVLCGGFPCQPFSSIGRRQGFNHPTQGTLFFYIRQIIKECNPKAFFLENVPGLITHDNGNTYKVVLQTLREELGYDTWAGVLDAADFGVPQYRKRLYLVGFRKSLGLKFDPPKGKYVGHHVGIGQFLEENVKGYDITRHLQQSYIFKKDDGHPQIVDKNSDFPVKTLCATYHKIQRITGTFVRDGGTGLRLLTVNECKAIQGYPKDFVVPVSRTSMHHQFGNSVAVPVIESIAKLLVKQLLKAKE